MTRFLEEFISECENRLKMYEVDLTEESLFKLEEDLKKKAWDRMHHANVPAEFAATAYADLIKVIDYVISKKIGESIYYGRKNFRYYVDRLSEKHSLRWLAVETSGKYALVLQQKSHYWVESARVGKLFDNLNEVEQYLAELESNTGVALPLENNG